MAVIRFRCARCDEVFQNSSEFINHPCPYPKRTLEQVQVEEGGD